MFTNRLKGGHAHEAREGYRSPLNAACVDLPNAWPRRVLTPSAGVAQGGGSRAAVRAAQMQRLQHLFHVPQPRPTHRHRYRPYCVRVRCVSCVCGACAVRMLRMNNTTAQLRAHLRLRFGGQLYIHLRARVGAGGHAAGGPLVGGAPGRRRRQRAAQAGLLLDRERASPAPFLFLFFSLYPFSR